MTRFVNILALTLFALPLTGFAAEQASDAPELTVYKTPTCGCCGKWVNYMEANGFTTRTIEQQNLNPLKESLGLIPRNSSCHTALTESGLFIEGHVPARYVEAFLSNPPADAAGLTVPQMPVGSPGMESGDRFMPYQVLLVKTDGSTEVYASVNSPNDQ